MTLVQSKVGGSEKVKRRREPTPRRKLFYLHSWLGFNLAIFMTLVCLTGTLAVIADEIDWLLESELRATPDGDKVSWGDMERAIRDYAPTDTLIMLSAGEQDYFAYRALMQNLAGKTYYLYVNQWNGEITGTTSSLTVQRFLRDLHRYLFMPAIIGLPLVTTMAVVLLISLYTGLKTTRNWGTVATRVRFNKGFRVAVGDFHKAIGLWGSWFLILIVVTSFWYFAELSAAAFGGVRFEPARPAVSAERAAEFGVVAKDADSDTLVEAAMAVMPGFVPTEIQYATRPGLAVTVLGKRGDWLVRQRANRVFLDPVDASVIKAQRSTEIGWVAYLNETADPLHFGSFNLLSVKLVWFVFGMGLVLMSVTGVYLTWKRVKSATPSFYQLANIPVLILATVFGVPYVSRYLSSGLPEQEVMLSPQVEAGINMRMLAGLDAHNEPSGEIRILASTEEGRLNLLSATLAYSGNPGFEQNLRPGSLSSYVVFRGLLPAEELSNTDKLTVTLNFASGEEIITDWNFKQEITAALNSENVDISVALN